MPSIRFLHAEASVLKHPLFGCRMPHNHRMQDIHHCYRTYLGKKGERQPTRWSGTKKKPHLELERAAGSINEMVFKMIKSHICRYSQHN